MASLLKRWILSKIIDPVVLRLISRHGIYGVNSPTDKKRVLESTCISIAEDARIYPEARLLHHANDKGILNIGRRTHVRGELLTFWNGGNISIGDDCYVGEQSRIWSQGSIRIGNNVSISHLVDIHDSDSHPLDAYDRRIDLNAILQGSISERPNSTQYSSIVIEDDVWICFKASILKGVSIGEGAIVAACSVVTKSIPPWTLVAGNPARVVRTLKPNDRK